MLLREHAIKRWFVIPPLLTNVSALRGETWKWTPEIVSFSVMLYTVSRKLHYFGLLYLRHSSSQYLPSTFTTGLTKNSSLQPSFDTATDTISDEENVGRQCSRRPGAMSHTRTSSRCSERRHGRPVSRLATLQWTRERFFVREDKACSESKCRFRDTVYCMTEKTQFPGFMFPRVVQRH